jgi:hypothetical protein
MRTIPAEIRNRTPIIFVLKKVCCYAKCPTIFLVLGLMAFDITVITEF